MPCAMPVPALLSTASIRTHQRMIAACRSGSGSASASAASPGCIADVREKTHPVASRSTSMPTGLRATATATASPECAREKDRPLPVPAPGGGPASTGLPDGPPQAGHLRRPNASRPGSAPTWPASTRRSITCATWYLCRSAGNAKAAARAVSRGSRSARSAGPRVISLMSNHQTSARSAAAAWRDALVMVRPPGAAVMSPPAPR